MELNTSHKSRLMIFLSILSGFLLWSPFFSEASPNLIFNKKGLHLKTYSLGELKALSAPSLQKIHDPHTKDPLDYWALNFSVLLETIYGPSILKAIDLEVLFSCLDGYKVSVPMGKFSEANSYLAYEIVNKKKFILTEILQAEEKIDLGPFYLVWLNKNRNEMRSDKEFQ